VAAETVTLAKPTKSHWLEAIRRINHYSTHQFISALFEARKAARKLETTFISKALLTA